MDLLIIDAASSQPSIGLINILKINDYTFNSHQEIPRDRCAELLIEKIQLLLEKKQGNESPGKFPPVDAIVVTTGPGGWTGLRIGVTVAKTMAWSLGLPVLGVKVNPNMSKEVAGQDDNEISCTSRLEWIVNIAWPRIEKKEYDDPFRLLPYYDKEPNITTPKKR